MCLVYNDGIVLALGGVHLLIDDRELLQRGDNNALSFVDRVKQILRTFLVVDGFYAAERVVKTGYGRLELLI